MTDTSNTSALSLVETLKPADVFQNNGLDPLLEAVKKEVDTFIPDISSKRGRDEIKSFAHKIARSKTALDKLGADLVSEWKAQSKKVDLERSRAWDFLEKLQKQVRKPLDEFESKEEERIKRHEASIGQIEAYKTVSPDANSEYIQNSITTLEKIETGEQWEEFEARAFRIKSEALVILNELLSKRLQYEKDQADLKRLREEQVIREQKEREDKIAADAAQKAKEEAEAKAKQEAEELTKKRQKELQDQKDQYEKVEREKQAAIEAQNKAEADAKAAIEKAAKDKADAEERAKQAAIKAEADKKAAEEKAREDERKRLADEQAKKELEAQKREADLQHRKKINNEALTALVASSGLNEDQAKSVVEAIAKGLIPNVKISY